MGERLDKLEKILSEAESWISFSESGMWKKLRERIEAEVVSPAKEAFWNAEIDTKSDEQLIRNTLTQRAVVKTALKIVDIVERNKLLKERTQKEIERIPKAEAGPKANNP